MCRVVSLVVLVACVSMSLGAPQLFPFSNLHQFLDPKLLRAAVPVQTAAPVDSYQTVASADDDPTDLPTFPPNHRQEQDHAPFPAQVLIAPGTEPALSYDEQLPPVVLLPPLQAQDYRNPIVTNNFNNGDVTSAAGLPDNYDSYKPAKVNKNQAYPKKFRPDVSKNTEPAKYEVKKTNKQNSKKVSQPQLELPKVPATAASANSPVEVPFFAAPKSFSGEQQQSAGTDFAPIATISGGHHLGSDEVGFARISSGGGGGGHGHGHGLGSADVGIGGGDQRVEFQMHGQHGPNSYKFGYDTGKGKNRQFRYEERDKDGHVRGHYGFYNKHGKLNIVNYSADKHGFKTDGGNLGHQ